MNCQIIQVDISAFKRKPLGHMFVFRSIFVLGLFFSAFLCSTLCSSNLFADTIRIKESLLQGEPEERSLTGTVQTFGKDAVQYLNTVGQNASVPAQQILWIQFDEEPPILSAIRMSMETGRFEEALTQLDSIASEELKKVRPLILQEIDYYRAWATGELTLTGSGPAPKEAGKALSDFLKKYPDTYHFYTINSRIADILMLMDQGKAAKTYYEKVKQAPWDDTKLSAEIKLGELALQEKNSADAQKSFQTVLDSTSTDGQIALLKNWAKVGVARVLTLEKKYDEAVKALELLMKETSADDTELQAELYNALGESYLASGQSDEALLAFLHVDLLFSSARVQHVHALRQLVPLWQQAMRPDRANEAAKTLRVRYKILINQ